MGRDVHEAYVRAIESGIVDENLPSRRHRRKILAVGRVSRFAAVAEADRGKRSNGFVSVDIFRRAKGVWRPIGGGSSGTDCPSIPDRSSLPDSVLDLVKLSKGLEGGFFDEVHAAVLRAGSAVAEVRWRGNRQTPSPTGFAVVLWRGPIAPLVKGLDAEDRLLAELRPRFPSRFVGIGRIRPMAGKGRSPGGWFRD